MIVRTVDAAGQSVSIDLTKVECVITGTIRNKTSAGEQEIRCSADNTIVQMRSGKAIVLRPREARHLIEPFIDYLKC